MRQTPRPDGRAQPDGFTLIELMVVVLIIAILLAIAIPTFLTARSKAQARGAQPNLRNALTAEKTVFTDDSSYSADVSATGPLRTAEPSINWVSGAVSHPGEVGVSVSVPAADSVMLVAMDASRTRCWVVFDETSAAAAAPAGTQYSFSGTAPDGTCAVPRDPTAPPSAGPATTADTWYSFW